MTQVNSMFNKAGQGAILPDFSQITNKEVGKMLKQAPLETSSVIDLVDDNTGMPSLDVSKWEQAYVLDQLDGFQSENGGRVKRTEDSTSDGKEYTAYLYDADGDGSYDYTAYIDNSTGNLSEVYIDTHTAGEIWFDADESGNINYVGTEGICEELLSEDKSVINLDSDYEIMYEGDQATSFAEVFDNNEEEQ